MDAKELQFATFGVDDRLTGAAKSNQVSYLRRYLDDIGAVATIEEQQYFDRDYLSEFSAFYSTSCAGYPNTCRRIHFFSTAVDRTRLVRALEGDQAEAAALQGAYLGFVVCRPIPSSPIGRTVLKWYPDRWPTTPRVSTPSREYSVCLAGLPLTVEGLAWQQQDSAVGACATIALWSLLHSSGFDRMHAIPTTADVTRAAHRNAPFGKRVFPSGGLNVWQLCEAIKAHGLSPVLIPGSVFGSRKAFGAERFCASTSALIRSGFPVIMTGGLERDGQDPEGHAVCAVGFRSKGQGQVAQGDVAHHDREIPNLYIHDDNIGPSARFVLEEAPEGFVFARPQAPQLLKPTALPDPTVNYPRFVPDNLVVAFPDDIRTSPDVLHAKGIAVATRLSKLLDTVAKQANISISGLSVSTRFVRLRDYLSTSLPAVLGTFPTRLGRTRIALAEAVPPMSLYLGVVRLGDANTPLLDILFDTTDSDANHSAFAHVVFDKSVMPYVMALARRAGIGATVDGS